MPQQINLCTPILLTQKRYFSAQTMAQALAVFVLLGGGLCAYWVWSLNAASDGFKVTLATQARELASLQAAIQQGKASVGPIDPGLTQDLQARQTALSQREELMKELQRGLFRPGFGHAARLQLVAQSIPAQAWITGIVADENRLEVNGFTLEPAALNPWVNRLAANALLQGQELSAIKVENATVVSPAPTATATPAAVRPTWSFSLVSTVAQPLIVTGVKP